RLDVTRKPSVNPVQGPDEQEPNDSFDQANPLALQDLLPDDGSGMTLRSGSALGICGGPTNDQDFFQFAVKAGEHVQVGVDGFVCDPQGGVFASVQDWIKANHIRVPKGVSLSGLLQNYPDVATGMVQLTVFDSQGNAIGKSSDI